MGSTKEMTVGEVRKALDLAVRDVESRLATLMLRLEKRDRYDLHEAVDALVAIHDRTSVHLGNIARDAVHFAEGE